MAATASVCGCAHGPRDVRKVRTATPLARARAVGRANGQPDSQVMRTLVGRLADTDPVVRLAAHEELRKRTGCDFRLCSVGKRRGTRAAHATLAGLGGTGQYESTHCGSVGSLRRVRPERLRRPRARRCQTDEGLPAEDSPRCNATSTARPARASSQSGGLAGPVRAGGHGLCGGRDAAGDGGSGLDALAPATATQRPRRRAS